MPVCDTGLIAGRSFTRSVCENAFLEYASGCAEWLEEIAKGLPSEGELSRRLVDAADTGVADADSCYLVVTRASDLSVCESPLATWDMVYIECGTYPAILYCKIDTASPSCYEAFSMPWAKKIAGYLLDALDEIVEYDLLIAEPS